MDHSTSSSANYRLSRLALALVLSATVLPATASPLEQAKRMHDRLTGVPPSAAVLADMQAKIAANNAIGAANVAMSNPAFYNATLKNWITPWTNRDGDKFAPLNDYTATVIGIIRDDLDYRQVLSGDILYVPNSTFGTYSSSNNAAYTKLETDDGDMGDPAVLEQKQQSSVTGLQSSATAGIITTRAAARAFFIDGTNRAMFRFTLKNHLCLDLEQVQDTTRPTDRIRQDISRSPGGDSRIFMNTCVSCHSGMDPMAQAFAHYNFAYNKSASDQNAAMDAGALEYTPSVVQPKYFNNANHFVEGYVTPDDRWDNYWRAGPNASIFGWANGGGTGHGAQSMAAELANSQAFAVCSVKKVFKAVCLRDPASGDQSAFTSMLGNFKSGHHLKQTFAEAAAYCSGD